MLGHARTVLVTARAALVLATYAKPSAAITYAEVRARAQRWCAGVDEAQPPGEGPVLGGIAGAVRRAEIALHECVEAMAARSRAMGPELLRLRVAVDRLEGTVAQAAKAVEHTGAVA